MRTGLERKNWRGGYKKAPRIIQFFLFSTIFTKSEHTQKRDIQIIPVQAKSKNSSPRTINPQIIRTTPKNHGLPMRTSFSNLLISVSPY